MRRFIAKIVKTSQDSPREGAIRNLACAILLALVLGMSAAPALAQGCAMCYATARATPKDGQRALNRAILVMIFPPIGAITLGVRAAIRYSKERDRERDNSPR